MPQNIGKRIHEARRNRGWSSHILADAYGVTDGTIAAWEAGLMLRVPAYDLGKLADLLDVSEHWLRTGEGPTSRHSHAA